MKRLKFWMFVVLLCLITTIGAQIRPLLTTVSDKGKATTMPNFESKIRQLKFEYMNYCQRQDRWWLADVISSTQSNQLMPMVAGYGDQIIEASKIISAASKEGQQIIDFFTPLGIAVIGDQGVRFLAKHGQTPKLYICFIPQSLIATQRASCWYNGDTVNLYAVEWAHPSFPALLGHELGHAYRHQAKRSSASAEPAGSDIRVDEEIWAHTFESQILDYQSSRRYLKTMDRVLDRLKVKSWQEAMVSLDLSDLKELDKTLRLTGCDIQTASLMLDEHLLIIGFRFVDRLKLEQEQKQQQKRAIYRQLP